MEDYLSRLNEPQRAAVEYTDGPALVIAGAGSGKTRVLTYKIVHLLAKGYEPWRILALTFTNKAAREMRERIEQLVGEETARKLWMGTFHSIFARILRVHAERLGYKRDYTIYDASDSKALIKTIIRDMQLDDKIYKPSVVQNAISMAKNALMSPDAYAKDRDLAEADRRARRPLMPDIYRLYVSRCRIAGAMDFDDLLYNTNVLLRDNPDILHHYQEYFSYILVDEYQDTNFAQHLIVSQLAAGAGENRLCVVGDDAQSIYSFRGANIRNILNLREAYPNLKIFKLEQNYRSTGNIINAANTLIAHNRHQIPKHVFTTGGAGERLEVVHNFSEYEESYMVANRISQLHLVTGDKFDEFAVLYRTNAQSRVLEESLRKRNIPYRIYGGLSFYQRKEIKDAIAYFRLAVNPDDDEALRRIINFPARGIGDTTLGKLAAAAFASHTSIWRVLNDVDKYQVNVNSGTKRKLETFANLVNEFIDKNLRGMDASTLGTSIIERTGLMSMLVTDTTPESISKQENLSELLNGLREFVSDKEESGDFDSVGMSYFLTEVSLATDQDKSEDGDADAVTLMTVHAAKGLEFGNVIVVGVEEDLFPSAMSSSSPMEIEEERRLMYVAITRAKRRCILSYAGSRFRNGQPMTCRPSRFINDIDRQYLKAIAGTNLDSVSQVRVDPVSKYKASFHSMRVPAKPAPQYTAPGQPAGDLGNATQHTSAELKTGMKIRHQRFGDGIIEDIDTSNADHRIRVRFSNVDTKTLLLKFAKFTIL